MAHSTFGLMVTFVVFTLRDQLPQVRDVCRSNWLVGSKGKTLTRMTISVVLFGKGFFHVQRW